MPTFVVFAVLALLIGKVFSREFYTAAVYDLGGDSGIPSNRTVSRKEALVIMNHNLDVLEAQAILAKSQGADIMVFPEYGISGRLIGRKQTSMYLEMIPDPISKTSYCPCDKDYVMAGEQIQHRLSCIAKENSIYIAANMGDKQPCLKKDDVHCPIDGQYQYNTEVVFNNHGCLVAKYHKQHLFLAEKLRWDVPRQVEYAFFDTTFGRFGLMVCFDAVFDKPAIDLVEQYNVTDIIFSTAWMNVYPHFISIAYHSGWARTMNVNYLMSNIHYPSSRLLGSGIYGPDGVLAYAYKPNTLEGTLVVANVPINKQQSLVEISPRPNITTSSSPVFESQVFGDMFLFTALSGLSGNTSICYNSTVCCFLEFSRSNESELYALGVFNSMHYLEGTYYLEVCMLVPCSAPRQCGQKPISKSTNEFQYFNLTALMDTKYAFPEVVTTDYNFSVNWDFTNKGYSKSIIGQDMRINSVALMGRNYNKDPSSYASAVASAGNKIIFTSTLWLGIVVVVQLTL